MQPRYTILDVVENFDRIDPQYLKDIIHRNEIGPDVLPGPQRFEDSEIVQAHHIDKILSVYPKPKPLSLVYCPGS